VTRISCVASQYSSIEPTFWRSQILYWNVRNINSWVWWRPNTISSSIRLFLLLRSYINWEKHRLNNFYVFIINIVNDSPTYISMVCLDINSFEWKYEFNVFKCNVSNTIHFFVWRYWSNTHSNTNINCGIFNIDIFCAAKFIKFCRFYSYSVIKILDCYINYVKVSSTWVNSISIERKSWQIFC